MARKQRPREGDAERVLIGVKSILIECLIYSCNLNIAQRVMIISSTSQKMIVSASTTKEVTDKKKNNNTQQQPNCPSNHKVVSFPVMSADRMRLYEA